MKKPDTFPCRACPHRRSWLHRCCSRCETKASVTYVGKAKAPRIAAGASFGRARHSAWSRAWLLWMASLLDFTERGVNGRASSEDGHKERHRHRFVKLFDLPCG